MLKLGCLTIAAVCRCLACCSPPICHNHSQFSHQWKPLVLKALSASYQPPHHTTPPGSALTHPSTQNTRTHIIKSKNNHRSTAYTLQLQRQYTWCHSTTGPQCLAQVSHKEVTDPTHLTEQLRQCQPELQSTPILIWLHQRRLSLPTCWALFSCQDDQ